MFPYYKIYRAFLARNQTFSGNLGDPKQIVPNIWCGVTWNQTNEYYLSDL